MKCFVSAIWTVRLAGLLGSFRPTPSNSPCVTKLPKFLPTTQCHVAPLRESNCDVVSDANGEETMGCADLFLNVLGDVLESVSVCKEIKDQVK